MIQIQWTAPNLEEARAIARALVENRWAACAQLIPGVQSIYVWQGKIEEAQEVKVLLKTIEKRLSQVEAYISEHASYDTPEISIVAVDQVAPAYLAWVNAACEPPSR